MREGFYIKLVIAYLVKMCRKTKINEKRFQLGQFWDKSDAFH